MVKWSNRHTASARGSFSNTAAENASPSITEGLLEGTQGDVRGKLMISALRRARNAKTLNSLPGAGRGGPVAGLHPGRTAARDRRLRRRGPLLGGPRPPGGKRGGGA